MPRRHQIPAAVRQQSEEIIAQVCTVPEACALWDKPRNTLLYAIDTGNVIARKSGKTWILSLHSLVALWGKPKSTFSQD